MNELCVGAFWDARSFIPDRGTARARGEDGMETDQKDVDAAGAVGGPGGRAGDVERPPAGTEGRRGPRRPRELECLDFQQREGGTDHALCAAGAALDICREGFG